MNALQFTFPKILLPSLCILLGVVFGVVALELPRFREEYSSDLLAAVPAPQENAPSPPATTAPAVVPTGNQTLHHYIEITASCSWDYSGVCVNMRSGPGTHYPVLARLRTGIILEVESAPVQASDGTEWYKVILGTDILYPDRMPGPWYVAVEPSSIRAFDDPGEVDLASGAPATGKKIIVDLSTEMLTAYNADGSVFMQAPVSTGLADTPTPAGTFRIFKKTPSRYMEGPTPGVSEQAYDLPGVPWDMYFTAGGAAIHGAYWHNDFGQPHSHGCVNLPLQDAETLYPWTDIGTPVAVVN